MKTGSILYGHGLGNMGCSSKVWHEVFTSFIVPSAYAHGKSCLWNTGGQPCVGTGKIALLSLQLLGKERKDAEGQFAFQVPARGNAEHAQLAGTCLRAGWRASKCKYEHWGGIHNKPFSWLPALF